jgi:hypothetical protein
MRRSLGPAFRHASKRLSGLLVGLNKPTGTEGALAVIYGEPDSLRFIAAVQRLKRQQRKKERLTRLAKQRVRMALRKMREC